MLLDHVRRMAGYNRWANDRLCAACAALSANDYTRARPAFFGSIHGTLNHMLVADRLWLARVEGAPPPHATLDEIPWANFAELSAARDATDRRLEALTLGLSEADLATLVHYTALTSPGELTSRLEQILLHVFNHATHHRGQVHDQLVATEVAPPPLDLMIYLREVEPVAA